MKLMKLSVPILLLAVFFMSLSAEDRGRDGMIMGFLTGDYILIGKKIDSDETYLGRASFLYNEKSRRLDLTRTVNGVTVSGHALLEPVLGGEAQVLRIYFEQDGIEYQGTFLWQADLDNFGRFSGYIYQKDSLPDDPGLEAYFIVQGD